MRISENAKKLAERTSEAYSSDRYASWQAVAALLLLRGYSEREAEAILRSKWTRWAADSSPAKYGKVPAKAVTKFLDSEIKRLGAAAHRRDVAQLVLETF